MIRVWLWWVSRWMEPNERERWREEWRADLDALQRRGATWWEKVRWGGGVGLAVFKIRTEGASMDGWGREVKNAIRSLLRRPAFTGVAVLTLGLGIGANTAIFSVVNGVVLEPLRYPESDELVMITTAFPQLDFYEFWMSPPEYMELTERSRSYELFGAYNPGQASVGGGEQPERVVSAIATASFFDVLGVSPALGRIFTEEEDIPSGPAVAVMSWELFNRSYGGDRSLLGSTIEVNGVSTTIVGVMPEGYDIDDNQVELWTPMALDWSNRQNRGSHYLEVVGRLRQGITIAAATQEMRGLIETWGEGADPNAGHLPNPETHPFALEGLHDEVVGDVGQSLMILLGAVGFVLLIACANVGNLLLARAEDRQKEVSVRVALGAGRGRLLRQFLSEGVVLSFAGAVVGLGVAWISLEMLKAFSPGDVPRLAEIDLDGTVLAVTTAIAVGVGVFFGLAPARHVVMGNLASSLRDGGTRTTDTAGRRGLRSLLVVSEMALALMLAVGAGLMLRSFEALTSVEPGFDTENTVAFGMSLPGRQYQTHADRSAFWMVVEEQLQAHPAFESVTLTSGLPTQQPLSASSFGFETLQLDPNGPGGNADYFTSVNTSFFETLGIPLLEGRLPNSSDGPESERAVVVNRAFQEKYFPGGTPVGDAILFGPAAPPNRIVGVVENIKQNGLDQPSGTEIYFHMPQNSYRTMYAIGRLRGDVDAAAAAAREVVWGLDPALPIEDFQTMDGVLGETVARSRFLTGLMSAFAGLALLLAAVGTYGVMSYSVSQRGRELGIRMAMGAQASAVQRLVLGQGLFVAMIGLVIGVGGAWGLTGFLESLLFNIDVRDPLAFFAGPVLLTLVAVVACWLPARRATRVDPVTVLKEE